jgi:seryl-tRNA synthetase
LAAVSRCYRAETSSIEEERGLYRVHEFTKVELFGVTAAETEEQEESSNLHQEILALEESLFSKLGIHFKTLEMPPSELGLPAFRKFDIEAWMPGRKMFGEISSCSNCTDFQSRRLNIRYKRETKNGDEDDHNNFNFVHTVNGTAMAIPRMLITLIETCQQSDGTIKIPSILEKFMSRPWEESVKMNPQYKTDFLRTKTAQMKYTKKFRKLELTA